jgi:hypothetical protein
MGVLTEALRTQFAGYDREDPPLKKSPPVILQSDQLAYSDGMTIAASAGLPEYAAIRVPLGNRTGCRK